MLVKSQPNVPIHLLIISVIVGKHLVKQFDKNDYIKKCPTKQTYLSALYNINSLYSGLA